MNHCKGERIFLCLFLLAISKCFCFPFNSIGSTQKILLIHSGFTDDVEFALKQTGRFSVISTFHAGQGTPALQLLALYDAVLVWSLVPFHDSASLGDALADYWDAGGRVVLAQFAMTNSSIFETARSSVQVQGRFGSPDQGYVFLAQLDSEPVCGQFTLARTAAARASPLLAGVNEVGSPGCVDRSAAINGGKVVASWSNGYPLLVRGTRRGRCLIAINAVPRSILGRDGDQEVTRGVMRVTGIGSCRASNSEPADVVCMVTHEHRDVRCFFFRGRTMRRRPPAAAGRGCCRTPCWRARRGPGVGDSPRASAR